MVLFSLLFMGQTQAAELDLVKISKELPPDTFKEIAQIPDKPHFVLGLEPKDDEWEQFLELRKLFQTKTMFFGKGISGLMDKSRKDYVAAGNTQVSEVLNVEGKDVKVLYTHYHFTKEGMYAFWSVTGEKNLAEFSPFYRKYEIRWGLGQFSDEQWKNVQRVLGWAQFEAVKNLVHDAIRGGLKKNVKDYAEINLTEGVLGARAALLDDPEYSKRLDNFIPGTANLKVRDILPVPLTRAIDFTPDLIIIGASGMYGAFANALKTVGTESIVFFDILGLAYQYVKKNYNLVGHEFVHANPHLQGLPLALYYDVEMWAALTTDLDDGMLSFISQSYLSIVRDSVRTTFGYDFQEVEKRIFTGSFGVRDVREREFRTHADQVKKIRDELLRFIKDPKNGLMVTFFQDPYYWLTVNTKFCDSAAAYRILFALRYEPAGLFDPNKKDKDGSAISPVRQTKEWLMKEEEAGRIKRLAEMAMSKTGEPTEFAKKAPKIADQFKCPVDSRTFFMTEQEKNKFMEIVHPLAERAEKGDVEATVLLMRIFGSSRVLSNRMH